MMEAPPRVCYSRGVIDSLVDKLTVVKETHPMVDPLLMDLVRLREDLVNKFSGATHWQVKVWMKQSRQLFYDIEDMIDLKTEDVDESDKDDFEEQINEFKAKIEEARTHSERYDLLDKAHASGHEDAAPSKVLFDTHLICEKKSVLVGINDGPRKERQELLKDRQKNKKVVAVLAGMGGVGKNTPATKVYEELNGNFSCHAFVTVGRNSSLAALMDAFRQLNPKMIGHVWNEQEVIPQL